MDRLRRAFDELRLDASLALRTLRARPGFAMAAIATFALGIGATSAIFSIVDGVLLRPLPFPDPDRLVRVWSASPHGIPRNSVSPPDFFDLQARVPAFERLAGWVADPFMLGGDNPERLAGATVMSDFFAALGVPPAHGRGFVAGDAAPENPTVVILSDRLWRRRFGGDPGIVGRSVLIDGRPQTVVGVMPPSFGFPSPDHDVWVPLADVWRTRSRSAHFLDVAGRLAPGATLDAAREQAQAVAARLAGEYPSSNRGWGVTIDTLHDGLVGGVRRPLVVLLAAVACVLLVSCANVGHLLLARGLGRSRELAVRTALGATRARIARQQLVESGVLALLGGACGLALAGWALGAFRAGVGYALPRQEAIALDARAVGATLLLTVLTGALAGLVPAWGAARAIPNDALRGGRGSPGGAATRARAVLVAVEVALTLALVASAALLLRSYATLAGVDAGFRPARVLLAQTTVAFSRYGPDERASFFDRALEEIRALPGVDAAGAGGPLPLSGQQGLLRFGVRLDGSDAPPQGVSDRVYLRWATPDYFRAMGIPILKGRAFAAIDGPGAPPVAVVDEAFAARHFPGRDPIGHRVRASNSKIFREIVGVIGSVRQARLEDEAEPHLYVPQAQMPTPSLTFVVRAAQDPRALAAVVRDRVQRLDPTRPLFNVRTLDDLVTEAVAPRRFNAMLVGLFAVLAASLAIVGIYGVIAFWVGESSREIGVRMALGATSAAVLALVMRRSLRLMAGGIAAGLALGFAGGRLVSSLLYGVDPTDPLSFAAAVGLVSVSGLLASYLPARRALAIDPVDALRQE